ncbi:hypothetical protein [Kribbella sindirgiensis]|uniref:Scaffolding protein n=1 Tax=Kribbella sindirgiensis TaxID=1124744 RepID=A0A4R0I067_9ACTN|nr:hypothetical protein [Kribbella sindirgiensis]TCC19958.1 hypothetical protein E0H50_37660 [Kribbella sindirgiensis]
MPKPNGNPVGADTDQTDETEVEETTDESTDETAEETDAEETTDETEDEESDEVPPEVLRKKLTKANADAANWRTKFRELEAKFTDAKTPEEFTAAVAELTKANAELARERDVAKVARKHKLPDELAELVKGDTPEEMDAHAKKLARFAGRPAPENLGGGLDPDEDKGEFDPVATVKRNRTNRFA